jgi:YegS/Rv2252/BmrU family lipid kinase
VKPPGPDATARVTEFGGVEAPADREDHRRRPVVRFRREEQATTVIVNPMASGGGAAEIWPSMQEALRQRFPRLTVRHTEGPDHAGLLCAEALESGAELVVAVGGDGTVNEVLQGFVDEDGRNRFPEATLGVLHAGTGGDFQRMFSAKGGQRRSRRVEALLDAPVRTLDYGVARFTDNEGKDRMRAFLNVASVGLSPEVVREVNASDKSLGALGYVTGALKGIARYRNQQVLISVDDGPDIRLDLTLACVANGQYFGGGMWMCPKSELDDGLFDVLTVSGMARRHLVATLAKVFRGRHLRTKGVDTTRARSISFEPVWRENRVLLELDGEQVGRLPAQFEIIERGMRLRVG